MTMFIVTGASRGIGAAIAKNLGATGAAIAVNFSHDDAGAREVVADIIQRGGKARSFQADVGNKAAVERLFADAERELGPLSGLVNCAGILGASGRTEDCMTEDLERLFAINVMGVMYCCGAAVKRLSTRYHGPGGAIVNISSAAARLGGMVGRVAYAASKGAVESFTKGFANEVAGEGIRVNAVAPGYVATDMIGPEMRARLAPNVPLGRVGAPEEIAGAVAWLMSDAASYVTGTVVTVAGGR